MSRSDIFESFVKIAQEKGLISKVEQTEPAEHAEHTEKDFSETNPRMDSLSIERISKLYNTKPARPKEMEYKSNIMETAHPDMVVLSPSHDKLNGLVENEMEGQNIRIHISLKEPDGHLTQRKYAEKQLIMSLVRAGNDLDSRNQDELRKLADVCLQQATGTPFRKTAQALAIAGLVAGLVATLYVQQHLRFHSDGFARDYQKASAEIDDLLTSNTNFGVGVSYTPAFLQIVNKLQSQLAKLNGVVQKVLPLLSELEAPKTGPELHQMAKLPKTQEVQETMKEFQAVFDEVAPFIDTVIKNFGNEGFKQRSTAEKGFMSSLVDSTGILHGGTGLVADDFDDVKRALQTLQVDIQCIAKDLQTHQDVLGQVTQQIQQSQAESASTFGNPPSAEKPEAGTAGLAEDAKGLLGGMLGATLPR